MNKTNVAPPQNRKLRPFHIFSAIAIVAVLFVGYEIRGIGDKAQKDAKLILTEIENTYAERKNKVLEDIRFVPSAKITSVVTNNEIVYRITGIEKSTCVALVKNENFHSVVGDNVFVNGMNVKHDDNVLDKKRACNNSRKTSLMFTKPLATTIPYIESKD